MMTSSVDIERVRSSIVGHLVNHANSSDPRAGIGIPPPDMLVLTRHVAATSNSQRFQHRAQEVINSTVQALAKDPDAVPFAHPETVMVLLGASTAAEHIHGNGTIVRNVDGARAAAYDILTAFRSGADKEIRIPLSTCRSLIEGLGLIRASPNIALLVGHIEMYRTFDTGMTKMTYQEIFRLTVASHLADRTFIRQPVLI